MRFTVLLSDPPLHAPLEQRERKDKNKEDDGLEWKLTSNKMEAIFVRQDVPAKISMSPFRFVSLIFGTV